MRERYIGSEEIAITLFASLKLGRPLLVEGAAGVGKTEIAKVLSRALNRPLVRLQCHEGIDEAKSLYEWNYQKQLLAIQGGKEDGPSLFSDTYLLERPLLKSIRSDEPVVLLIDEIDKSDEEFEAFLLEILSEMQVTIPELGTITATTTPFVVLTSNDTRPLSEALKRRCAYLYLQYPDPEKEVSIILANMPQADVELANQVTKAVAYLRQSERIVKKPSIAETLDWMGALEALGHSRLNPENARQTLGFVLKTKDDMDEILGDDDFDQCLS
ncbi:MAG: MoxR family ATPase [Eubacteriales bacterium]